MKFTSQMLYLYVTARPGNHLAIYPNNSFELTASGAQTRHHPKGTLYLKCPGYRTFARKFIAGYAKKNEAGVYFDALTEKRIGHLFDVIFQRIQRGDAENLRLALKGVLHAIEIYKCRISALKDTLTSKKPLKKVRQQDPYYASYRIINGCSN